MCRCPRPEPNCCSRLLPVYERTARHRHLEPTVRRLDSVLGSERLTGALLDRLTHHVSILTMNGESYRLKQSAGQSRGRHRGRSKTRPPKRTSIPTPARSQHPEQKTKDAVRGGPRSGPRHNILPPHQWPGFTPSRWPEIRPPLTLSCRTGQRLTRSAGASSY